MSSSLLRFFPFLKAPVTAQTRNLYDAVNDDDHEGVSQWLSKGGNPNQVLLPNQESAFDAAIFSGHVDLVEQMIANGAIVTVAHISAAILRQREAVVRFFNTRGVNWAQQAQGWRSSSPPENQSLSQQMHKVLPYLARELSVPVVAAVFVEKKKSEK